MIKKILTLIIVIIAFESNIYSEEIVSGFYVKNNNDTVYSKFLVHDLFELHYTINTIDSVGNKTCLKPSEIKAFSFNTQKEITTTTPCEELNHSFDKQLLSVGYVYHSKTFSLDSEIHASTLTLDSVYNYESCTIDSTLQLFLSIKNGLGGKLHADHYYTKVGDFPFYNTVWFMVKEQQIVKCTNNDVKNCLLGCISDYPLMKKLIQKNKIKSFPFDFHFVIDDYNSWSKLPIENRRDTSMTIKGFLDADKYYKTTKYFTISCVTGTAFFLPGMVSAVIMAHNPKEKNISIPHSLLNRENAEYSKAFKHRAYEKKYKAAGHGATTGGALTIGLIILLALL